MGINKRYIGLLLLTIFIVLIVPSVAAANSAYLREQGGKVEQASSSEIVLEKLITQVWLRKGFAEIEEVYQFRNTGEAQGFLMGLPEFVNTKASLQYGVYNFRAYVDGKRIESRTVKMRDQELGTSYGNINWHVNSVFVGEEQQKIVIHKYWVRIVPWENKLILPLDPAASWKGSIGEAYYAVYLMGDLTERDLVYPGGYGSFTGKYAITPTGFNPSKDQVTWRNTNYEPKRNLQIEIFPDKDNVLVKEVRPSGVHVDYNETSNNNGLNAFDGDPATAWAVGGPGKGDWLYISFGADKKWIREFRIIPGYASLETMFKYYNRPRRVTLLFPNETKQSFMLKDELDMQYFPIKPVHTTAVVVRIDSVYKGIYPDVTYISEIEFGQLKTDSRIIPSDWKIGLDQARALNLRPRYSTTELITIGATALVFLFILWQVIVALRMRKEKAKVA